MTIENDFLPYAVGTGANVISQSNYAGSSILALGAQSGVANSATANKAWRQSSLIASVIAQFIVAQTSQPAVDDGTTATLLTNFEDAIEALIFASGNRVCLRETYFTAAGTFTPMTLTAAVEIDCVGGGGAGGTCPATSGSQNACASGGWSGGWIRGRFNSGFGTPTAGISVVIGSGGAVGSTPQGGGASSVASLLSAGGGQPGNSNIGTASGIIAGAAVIGSTNTGAGLVVNSGGSPGSFGICSIFNNQGIGGNGGSTPWGGGAPGGPASSGGPGVATGYGSGGAGSYTQASQGITYGTAGRPGVVIIREYASTF